MKLLLAKQPASSELAGLAMSSSGGELSLSVELADSQEELQTSTPSLVLAPHTFCSRRLSSCPDDSGFGSPEMGMKLASAVEERLRSVPCLNATRKGRDWDWNDLVAKAKGAGESKLGRPQPPDVVLKSVSDARA